MVQAPKKPPLKEVDRIKHIVGKLSGDSGRRVIASDELSDYEYPKREDEWPKVGTVPDNTPVGKQASEAQAGDQRIYKGRRRLEEYNKGQDNQGKKNVINSRRSRQDQAKGPPYMREYSRFDPNKLSHVRSRIDETQRKSSESNLPIRNAARKRLKQR